MIKTIDEAVMDPIIRLELIRKYEHKAKWIGPPPNPLVNITTRCKVYYGSINDSNYMRFQASNKLLDYSLDTVSHIVAYVLYVGARGSLQVQHKCGVRHCSNYEHLILGLHGQNGTHASKTRAQSKPNQDSWKLSEIDRIDIRDLSFSKGYPTVLLADMYEVTVATITRALTP